MALSLKLQALFNLDICFMATNFIVSRATDLSQPERISSLPYRFTQENQRNSWIILDWTFWIPLKVAFFSENKEDVINSQLFITALPMSSQCRSAKPKIRTLPFCLTDLSKKNVFAQ